MRKLFKMQRDLSSYNTFVISNKLDFRSKINFRIMTYNVEGFKDYDGVLKIISESQCEIIGLNEALFFTDSLREKFTLDVSNLGYNIKMCNTYGINVILSKYPIESSKVIKLEKDLIKNRNRYALKVKISGLEIILTHLDVFDNTGETRLKQIKTISSYVTPNCILMGDFNSVKNSNIVNLIETLFEDSFTRVGKTQPPITTWSFRVIDFIFIGPNFPYRILDSNIFPSTASDHFPVYIDL